MTKIHWLDDVAEHDYAAANAYLSIMLDDHRAARVIARLQHCKITHRRVNDILRACRREPLTPQDPGVQHTTRKITHHKPLSPILIISLTVGGDIADGYHRVSAAYHEDPFSTIPCKIAHMPELERTFTGIANL